MFTDQPVTPNRLECLIDLLREYSRQEWTRAKIISVLQPKGLPDLEPASPQAAATIKAGLELGLITQDGSSIKLGFVERSHLLGGLTEPGLGWSVEQAAHLLHIPATLGQRLDHLANPVRPLVHPDSGVGHQNEDGNQDRHVEVRDPVPVIEQAAPDAP